MPTLKQTFFAWWQYPLPHHALSRLVGKFTHSHTSWFKKLLIQAFIQLFDINLDEAVHGDPDAYACFNDFFTRPLKKGARPISAELDRLVSPVDGTISQMGSLTSEWLIQAKGKDYSVASLLGNDQALADLFKDGEFATLYLSPRDYHRVHMPLTGTLRQMAHIPGRLFSVNPATTATVNNLFARNERVTCLFDTEAGPMVICLVGALLVASIETVWHGVVTPPAGHDIRHWSYHDQLVRLERGVELGRFNMGSTVILLFGRDTLRWMQFEPGTPVKMGQELAALQIES